MSRTLALFASLLLAISASAGNNDKSDGENKCDDLDSVCVCSESLDESTSITPTDNFNMPSSTSKQCHGTVAFGCGSGCAGNTAFVTEQFMPANNTVQNVLRIKDSSNAISAKVLGTGQSFSTGTLCTRYYVRYDPAVVNGQVDLEEPAGDRLKWGDIVFGSESGAYCLLQNQWGNGGANASFYSEEEAHGYQSCGAPTIYDPSSGSSIKLSECQNNFCRMEMCVDSDAGSTVTRSRITRLSDGVSDTKTMPARSFAASIDNAHLWIANLYQQHLDGGFSNGYIYASYAMETFSSTRDPSFWIGAAEEVEPGGPPLLTVDATTNVSSGVVPLTGVVITGDPLIEGTGPNYRFKFDCNGDGTYECSRDVVDAPPVANYSSNTGGTCGTTICNSIYSVAGTYSATVLLEDWGANTPGTGSVISQALDAATVVVQGAPAQCPAEPAPVASAITKFQLWDTNTNTVIDSDFKDGDTIASADRSHVAVEAVGNSYLNTHNAPGSVRVYVDSASHCENESPFSSSSDNWPTTPTTFTADTAAGAIGSHVIRAEPYDDANCSNSGPVGPIKSVNFTTLGP